MKLWEQLEWVNWKRLNDVEKGTVFQKALTKFVSPKIEIVYMALVDFELYGIKCRTIELEIAGELFVFIPGNKEAILGWDSGVEGLRVHELLGFNQRDLEKSTFKAALSRAEIGEIAKLMQGDETEVFSSLDVLSKYINQRTSELRKVKIFPMIVQKYALPVGTKLLGTFDVVSGVYKGECQLPQRYEKKIKELLFPTLEKSNCLDWSFPLTVLEQNQFYLEFLPQSDDYFVYEHLEGTFSQLQQKLAEEGFSLLNSDQWEFMVGAGTRRLFRWGNELCIPKNQLGKMIQAKMNQGNMFGVVLDTTKTRYELTNQIDFPKLEKQASKEHHLIEKMLPLSSYYQTTHQVIANQRLHPDDYLYRKAIVLEE